MDPAITHTENQDKTHHNKIVENCWQRKKILKADKEYRHIVHRGTKIGMIEAFLSDAMQARRQ